MAIGFNLRKILKKIFLWLSEMLLLLFVPKDRCVRMAFIRAD